MLSQYGIITLVLHQQNGGAGHSLLVRRKKNWHSFKTLIVDKSSAHVLLGVITPDRTAGVQG